MMRQGIAIGFLFALLLCASTARAETASFFGLYGLLAVPFPASPEVTLPQFDPGLGTLTKVTLSLDAESSAGTIDWDNEAPLPTDITLGIGAEVTALTAFGTSVVSIPLQFGSTTGIAADNDPAADFVGSDSFSVLGGLSNDAQSTVLTLPLEIAPYIGVGTFDVTIGAEVAIFVDASEGEGPTQHIEGVVEGVVTVTYEYTPAPAPVPALSDIGRAVLIGLVLIGGSAIRSRLAHRRVGPRVGPNRPSIRAPCRATTRIGTLKRSLIHLRARYGKSPVSSGVLLRRYSDRHAETQL